MAGLLSIGLTGINASQANLYTASHNITNANTPGYTRQQVVLTSNDPQFSGSGFLGRGVNVDGVRRQYDQFLNQQVLNASARKEEYSAYGALIGQVDNLLADESAGLSPAISDFFRGVNDVANNPSSIPARQSMLSLAQTLAGRFTAIDSRLDEIRDLTEGQIRTTVEQINSYAKDISALNVRIAQVELGGAEKPANDLHDQRDALLGELNKLVKVSTFTDSNGALNVFIGNGQTLVFGGSAGALAVTPSATDPLRGEVTLAPPNGGGTVALAESQFGSGQLAGLLAFRSETLDRVQDELGTLAKGIAAAVNDVHDNGVDLNGAAGGDFFTDLGAVSAREAAGVFAVAVTDPALIAASSTTNPASGNNENALALAALQTTKLMNGNTATFQSAYSQTVSFVGNKSREVQVAEKAQESQLQQATEAQQALSGVNLDEEAANLIRFQQAYQASARVMSLAGTLFEEILGITR